MTDYPFIQWKDLRPGDEVMNYGEPLYTITSWPREVGPDEYEVRVRLGRIGPERRRTFVGHMTQQVRRVSERSDKERKEA